MTNQLGLILNNNMFAVDPKRFRKDNKRAGKASAITAHPSLLCRTMEKTDFSKIVTMPPNASKRSLEHDPSTEGFQINKFGTTNKCYLDDPSSQAFIKQFAPHAIPLGSDVHNLMVAAQLALQTFGPKALVLDLGTGVGKSANTLASIFAQSYVYTFDSFEGLPEQWHRKGGVDFDKGIFSIKGAGADHQTNKQLPIFLYDNVHAIRGPIEETLPAFADVLEKKPINGKISTQIALLHIDTDLYSSAKTALTVLEKYIGPRTILVFDEFYAVPGFLEEQYKGEYAAFCEFIKATRHYFAPLTFNALHEQMTIVIGPKNTAIDDGDSDAAGGSRDIPVPSTVKSCNVNWRTASWLGGHPPHLTLLTSILLALSATAAITALASYVYRGLKN